jgi:hypothetical protein
LSTEPLGESVVLFNEAPESTSRRTGCRLAIQDELTNESVLPSGNVEGEANLIVTTLGGIRHGSNGHGSWWLRTS